MRKQTFFEAGEDHDRELEALGAVKRHQPDARVARALLLVGVRQERQPIDKAPKRGLGLTALVLPRGRDELSEVFHASFRFFASLFVQILKIATLIEHLAD